VLYLIDWIGVGCVCERWIESEGKKRMMMKMIEWMELLLLFLLSRSYATSRCLLEVLPPSLPLGLLELLVCDTMPLSESIDPLHETMDLLELPLPFPLVEGVFYQRGWIGPAEPTNDVNGRNRKAKTLASMRIDRLKQYGFPLELSLLLIYASISLEAYSTMQ